MNLPETFYIALCVTILLLGAIYWFWTQLQYLQRKVNLLDNVVYEMKTLVSNLPAATQVVASPMEYSGGSGNDSGPAHMEFSHEEQVPYAPPPESVAGDLEAERMASELEFDSFSGVNVAHVEEQHTSPVTYVEPPVNDDLQPGGLASPDAGKRVNDTSIESPLNSMSIKELRRMAEANGIPGSSELKKKDLVRALREKVSTIVNPAAVAAAADDGPKIISFDDIAAPDGE
jgi:hypothetical protein